MDIYPFKIFGSGKKSGYDPFLDNLNDVKITHKTIAI